MSINRIEWQPQLSRKAFCLMDVLVTLQDLCSEGLMEGGNVFATAEGMRWYLTEKTRQPPPSDEELRESVDALRAAGIIES